jgi:dTDP-glucose pyrophosphorylase
VSGVAEFFISPGSTIGEAMARIDRNAKGIVLVVDSERRLVATITDGDLRRAILAGVDLGEPVERIRANGPASAVPITAPFGTPDAQLLRLMNQHSIRHIPLLDPDGRVSDIALLSELARECELPLTAVVMAGGYGMRLRPLTDTMPKPMLPVGDRPLLEHIVGQLRAAGVRKVVLATHYRGQLITDHFGDGRAFGIEIGYVHEDEPLGTAGALSMVMRTSQEPVLVVNGDVLTQVNFRAMRVFHEEHGADMTVGVKQYEFQVPYGVVALDGLEVTGISEKPLLRQFINAGIYLLNPDVCDMIPAGRRYDMPDLMRRLVLERRRVVGFPVRERWLDIGQPGDYEAANATVKESTS